jgi:hypothetical protein
MGRDDSSELVMLRQIKACATASGLVSGTLGTVSGVVLMCDGVGGTAN